jgi:hypothetical protein
MKSSPAQLRSRGYITEDDVLSIINKGKIDLVELTTDPSPWVRTVAVRLLGRSLNKKLIPHIITLLSKEKKLYTKLEICDLLTKYGIESLSYLLPLIGKIGKNQHKKPTLVDLKKQSFPLPRDLVARVIIRIGNVALPELERILDNGDDEQILESIDIIGHIAFNYRDIRSEKKLFELAKRKQKCEMTKWKIVRAFQAFPSQDVVGFLTDMVMNCDNDLFVQEAKRSLARIKNNYN